MTTKKSDPTSSTQLNQNASRLNTEASLAAARQSYQDFSRKLQQAEQLGQRVLVSMQYEQDLLQASPEIAHAEIETALIEKESLLLGYQKIWSDIQEHLSKLGLSPDFIGLANYAKQMSHYLKAPTVRQQIMAYHASLSQQMREAQALNQLNGQLIGMQIEQVEGRLQILTRAEQKNSNNTYAPNGSRHSTGASRHHRIA